MPTLSYCAFVRFCIVWPPEHGAVIGYGFFTPGETPLCCSTVRPRALRIGPLDAGNPL
jgi:hypothetical protein